jgi:hypothetical protein
MKKFSRDCYRKSQGRNLVAKARLAKSVTEEDLYPEFRRELILMRALNSGNLRLDKSKISDTISKMEALRLIVSLNEDEIEALTVFGIMPYIGVAGQRQEEVLR